MASSSRTTRTTTNNAYDQRTFIDDRDTTNIRNDYDIDNRQYLEVDNSVRNNYEIDNSVRQDIRNDNRQYYDVDNSQRIDARQDNRQDNRISGSYNTTNNIDQSDRSVTENYDYSDHSVDQSTNVELSDSAIYAAAGDVTINTTYTDHGAVEASLDLVAASDARAEETQRTIFNAALQFAGDVQEKSTALSKDALEAAFKSTVGGIQDSQQKMLATVSGIAVLAVAVTAFARR